MSKFSRENTALKMKGAGDGIRNLARSTERIPVPSSRKFTATMVKDESMQLRLKKALDDYAADQDRPKRPKKSATIAEITPTKSNRRKVKRPDVCTSVMLHATPRPPASVAQEPPSGRVEKQRRLELLVYHRMLVFVWRRSKAHFAIVSESLRRRQDQISKLEKQIECLKNLTQSECQKRGEAMGDCQRMEKHLQTLRKENDSLTSEKKALENSLDNLQQKLDSSIVDLENLKNEMDTKNNLLKRFEFELDKERIVVRSLKDENAALVDKVKAQAVEIRSQEEVTDKLNNTLRDLENHLRECEEQKKKKSCDLKKMTEQYRVKVKNYESLRHELSRVCSDNDRIKWDMDNLKDQLQKMNFDYDTLLKENEILKREMNKKRCIWRNTKDFLAVTWALIQNAAYIMLPAM